MTEIHSSLQKNSSKRWKEGAYRGTKEPTLLVEKAKRGKLELKLG